MKKLLVSMIAMSLMMTSIALAGPKKKKAEKKEKAKVEKVEKKGKKAKAKAAPVK